MTRDDGWRFLSLGRHLERAAVRHRDDVGEVAQSDDGRAIRRCSSGCSTCPTASSRIAPATWATPSGWPSPTCCCSTAATRARRRSSSPSSPSTCRCCPAAISDDARRAPRATRRRAARRPSLPQPGGDRRLPRRAAEQLALHAVRRADAALLQPRLRAGARHADPACDGRRLSASSTSRRIYVLRRRRSSTSQHVAYLRPRALPRQHVRAHDAQRRARRRRRGRGGPTTSATSSTSSRSCARTRAASSRPRASSTCSTRDRALDARRQPAVGRRAARLDLARRQPSGRRRRSSRTPSPYVPLAAELDGVRAPRRFPPAGRCSTRRIDLMHRIHARVHLRSGGDDDHDAGDAGARGAPRRLPGLRAPRDRVPALARARRRATSAATCSPIRRRASRG